MAIFVGLLILDGGFVYDDIPSIVTNPTFNGDVSFWTVFETDIWGSPLHEIVRGYRPLTNLFWKILWSISPNNPMLFRVFTLLFHMLATLALVRIVHHSSKSLWAAGAAGFLFAIHPIHAEALGGITWQSDVLSSAAGLGAIYFSLIEKSFKNYALVFLLLGISILTKESGFLFGIAIAASVLATPHQKKREWGLFTVASLLVLGAIVLQLSLDRGAGASGSNNLLYGASMGERALLGLSIVGRSLALLAVPSGLSPTHGYAEFDLSLLTLIPYALPGAVLLGLTAYFGLWSLWRKKPLVAMATMILMGPILLQSGLIIPVQTDLAERLLYPSSAAAVAFVALGMKRVPGSLKTTLLCFLVVVGLLGIHPVLRSWTSDEALWTRAVQIQPKTIRAQENYGKILLRQQNVPDGAWHLMVGTYLRLTLPEPPNWERVEALERKTVEERLMEGPALLRYPRDPCALLLPFIERMETQVPAFKRVTLPGYKKNYPGCFTP